MMKVLSFFRASQPKPMLTDQALIDRTYKRVRMSVMATITLGYGMMYTTRLPLSVVKPSLIDEQIFSEMQLGIIGSALFWGYALGKCINGFLADHANIRRFFSIGILMSALVNLLMGSTTWTLFWIILWGFNGWFQGFGAPSAAVTLSNWFSKNERGMFYGIWSSSHSIGEGLTFVGTAVLVSAFGWKFGFWAPGCIGLFVAVGTYVFMCERPSTLGLPPVSDWRNDHDVAHSDKQSAEESTTQLQLQVLKSPKILVLGLSCAMMYVTRYAINSWGIFYLQEAKNYSLVKSGLLLGLNTAAGIAGCIVYGFISDRFFKGRRPPVTLLFHLFEILALLVIFFAPAEYSFLIPAAWVVYGFTLSGLLAVLAGLFAIDIVSKKTAGAAMGIMGIFGYLAAGTQEIISGYLLKVGKTVVDGVTTYDFSVPIIFWIGSSVLSMVLAVSLWRVRMSD